MLVTLAVESWALAWDGHRKVSRGTSTKAFGQELSRRTLVSPRSLGSTRERRSARGRAIGGSSGGAGRLRRWMVTPGRTIRLSWAEHG